jgi:mRNA-degrading endonuclease toxin of MazEF toxin-antitoxin module
VRTPLPGEIYFAHAGNDTYRRVLVVSRPELNRGLYVVAVPFTSARLAERKDCPNCVLFEAGEYTFTRDCVAQCEAVAMVPVAKLDTVRGCVAKLSQDRLEEIHEAIKYALAMA